MAKWLVGKLDFFMMTKSPTWRFSSSTWVFAGGNASTHCATFSKIPSGCFEQVAIECDGVAAHLPVHLKGNLTFRLLRNETGLKHVMTQYRYLMKLKLSN
ncbi:hypothetical protein CDAR_452731 [Caerostris darwini]|uniref:Uncharacterized protein n=1 Tax=Caerostris darwini TaxID=1538125 RepID=A0AAV4SL83_9ARAC|nr:hypothetical protein CDAR_452731 [Caerostris darwini]